MSCKEWPDFLHCMAISAYMRSEWRASLPLSNYGDVQEQGDTLGFACWVPKNQNSIEEHYYPFPMSKCFSKLKDKRTRDPCHNKCEVFANHMAQVQSCDNCKSSAKEEFFWKKLLSMCTHNHLSSSQASNLFGDFLPYLSRF